MAFEKRALMIAPSYAALPEDKRLPGCIKDMKNMKQILLEKFDFKENDIKVFEGEQATKVNLLQAFKNLNEEVKSSSVVFVYYSGHGVYLPNIQDEGLLPTLTTWPIEDEEEECITGRDLLPFLDNLAKKKVKCFLIFDCCHSGQLYRVTEFKETGLRAKQVLIRGDDTEPAKPVQKKPNIAKRGGWTPDDKDYFTYIAACNTAQVALEEIGKGGRLTMAIENVINNLEDPKSVSYESFFRLLNREFKTQGWDLSQSPQLEGKHLDTVLFGTTQVRAKPSGIVIKDIPSDGDVVLDAGLFHNLIAGVYDVYETFASEESINQGPKSKHWLGTVELNEGKIGPVEAQGSIVERVEGKEINTGCLAYLKESVSFKENVYVNLTGEDSTHVAELVNYLKNTNMLNVSQQKPSFNDPDLITITNDEYEGKVYWVARRRTRVIIPYISMGRERIMANNLSRYLRYNMALKNAQMEFDEEDLLENVSLKVFKMEKVQPFNKYTRNGRKIEGLKGKDIFEDGEHRTTFKSHETREGTNATIDKSGDAFVFQVCNSNPNTPDGIVHICVLCFQISGAITVLYPISKAGHTIPLRGGDSAEEIFRVYIPKHSLRAITEPDLAKDEPNFGTDTLVLYASSRPVDFAPLLQTNVETDPTLLPRGDSKTDPLSDLKKFLKVNSRDPIPDDLKVDVKLFIKAAEMKIIK